MKKGIDKNDFFKALAKSPVAHLNQHLLSAEEEKKPKANKYHAIKVEFDGHVFSSKKECGYYIAMRSRQEAGEISGLQIQVPFELNPNGEFSYKYVADFVWVENGQQMICDTKGHKTKEFKKKERLMKEVYGIVIKIV